MPGRVVSDGSDSDNCEIPRNAKDGLDSPSDHSFFPTLAESRAYAPPGSKKRVASAEIPNLAESPVRKNQRTDATTPEKAPKFTYAQAAANASITKKAPVKKTESPACPVPQRTEPSPPTTRPSSELSSSHSSESPKPSQVPERSELTHWGSLAGFDEPPRPTLPPWERRSEVNVRLMSRSTFTPAQSDSARDQGTMTNGSSVSGLSPMKSAALLHSNQFGLGPLPLRPAASGEHNSSEAQDNERRQALEGQAAEQQRHKRESDGRDGVIITEVDRTGNIAQRKVRRPPGL